MEANQKIGFLLSFRGAIDLYAKTFEHQRSILEALVNDINFELVNLAADMDNPYYDPLLITKKDYEDEKAATKQKILDALGCNH